MSANDPQQTSRPPSFGHSLRANSRLPALLHLFLLLLCSLQKRLASGVLCNLNTG
jgi:hypothetical protein